MTPDEQDRARQILRQALAGAGWDEAMLSWTIAGILEDINDDDSGATLEEKIRKHIPSRFKANVELATKEQGALVPGQMIRNDGPKQSGALVPGQMSLPIEGGKGIGALVPGQMAMPITNLRRPPIESIDSGSILDRMPTSVWQNLGTQSNHVSVAGVIKGQGTVDKNANEYQKYLPGLADQWGGATQDILADNYFTNAERDGLGSATDDAIVSLFATNSSNRAVLNAVISMQFDDPDALTNLQFQLMQHGYFSDQPIYGQADTATMNAVQALIQSKWQAGSNMTLTELLARDSENYQDAQFKDMKKILEGIDQEAAQEMEMLREELDSLDLTAVLTDSKRLEYDIQDQAVQTLGRTLSDAEVQTLIGSVHDREVQDYKDNSPAYQRYQQLIELMTDAVTQNEARQTNPFGELAPSDLDSFMNAVMMQESGGDPNAVGPQTKYGTPFGLFQFLPATWAQATKDAGLDPNDRSAENQKAAARYLMTTYYIQNGGYWDDVARAWYAGPGSASIRANGATGGDAPEAGGFPSINRYADEILQRMQNGGQLDVDRTYAQADAASIGGGAGALPPEAVEAWWQERQLYGADNKLKDDPGLSIGGVSDLPTSTPGVGTREQFDMGAYLRSAVTEAGGVDADAYTYATTAQAFFDMLGAR